MAPIQVVCWARGGGETRALHAHTLEAVRKIGKAKSAKPADTLAALREARRNIELFARLHGRLPPPDAADDAAPDLHQVLRAVTHALAPYPEAARAVAARLLEMEGEHAR